MKVRDGMTTLVLTIGPAHTLREAARLMSSRRVGAAVVIDPEHSGVGILTERDILDSLAAGQDPNIELAAAHRTLDVVYASPDWTLQQAASTMVRAGFRHLVVVEGNEVTGLLSMRDIVRCWAEAGTHEHEGPPAERVPFEDPDEPFRDLTIGKSVPNQPGHLPLPDRQRGLPIASHSVGPRASVGRKTRTPHP